MDEQLVFEKALALWGEIAQIDMIIEEMAELTKALCKLKRGKPLARDEVLEEMADVQIMLNQMLLIFNRKQFDTMYKLKLDRLEKLVVKDD